MSFDKSIGDILTRNLNWKFCWTKKFKKIGKMFSYTFQNIAYLLGPIIQFCHIWAEAGYAYRYLRITQTTSPKKYVLFSMFWNVFKNKSDFSSRFFSPKLFLIFCLIRIARHICWYFFHFSPLPPPPLPSIQCFGFVARFARVVLSNFQPGGSRK